MMEHKEPKSSRKMLDLISRNPGITIDDRDFLEEQFLASLEGRLESEGARVRKAARI
ncbi:MAG: hypothetical protein NT080_12020 [Spirochaetes bacterium]|nr:hypothetical protein [Spirochaetota bacterium]